MATKKALSNKQNAQKSTGPKTARGKAVVGQNAVQHGLLSRSLVLPSEDPREFAQLWLQLQSEMAPVGTLEQTLVERIAIAIWRQRRLVAAETGMVTLQQKDLPYSDLVRVRTLAGLRPDDMDWLKAIAPDATELDMQAMQTDLDQLDDFFLTDQSLKGLAELRDACPGVWQALCDEAEVLAISQAKDQLADVLVYLQGTGKGLQRWLDQWEFDQRRLLRVLKALALVRQAAAVPATADVLSRYQTTLDNDVYKATRALREQQKFRMEQAALNADALPQ